MFNVFRFCLLGFELWWLMTNIIGKPQSKEGNIVVDIPLACGCTAIGVISILGYFVLFWFVVKSTVRSVLRRLRPSGPNDCRECSRHSKVTMSNTGEKSDVIFKKMTSTGMRNHSLATRGSESESMDNLCVGNESVDFPSIDSHCFMDNVSVDTASLDNNCCHDSLSIDNSSINVSMDLHDASESALDLQEITQSILDLEGTQTSRNSSEYGTCTELQGLVQVPSSPPPSYEHVLAETRLAQQAALKDATNEEESEDKETDENTSGNVTEPEAVTPPEPRKGIEIMHKSHKEFYKAVAKQWGITCKMSDHCRCLDCQSMYFDCEYDYNEQEKTDGGLGAGTPMFISEVMHGTACTLL